MPSCGGLTAEVGHVSSDDSHMKRDVLSSIMQLYTCVCVCVCQTLQFETLHHFSASHPLN